MEILYWLFGILVVLWAAVRLFLAPPDLSSFDSPSDYRKGSRDRASEGHRDALRLLAELQSKRASRAQGFKDQLRAARQTLDEGFSGLPIDAESLGVEIIETSASGVPAEWVIAPGADPNRRLLYIHGGAFFVGSPRSHRTITSTLSKLAGVAVLAIDYRLMPENRRVDSITDCQLAYRWILENGPDGPGSPARVFVSGDSAGGNLTLMLTAWIRDQGLRQVDAAIGLSPATDSTASGPSMRRNIKTDHMIGPIVGPLARLPLTLRLLVMLYAARLNPRNPLVSPLLGELHDLPPTLIQASECETLLDDAIRYVNKAKAAGSPADLQTWPGMLHVWQIFAHVLPEGREALQEIANFIQLHSGVAESPSAELAVEALR